VHALTGTLHDDDAVAFRAGTSAAASATVADAGRTSGVSHGTGCSLTQRIAASMSCNGMSCGSTPSPPRRASAARRGPVTEFMLDATSGIVAVEPSPGERSTSRRLVIADRRGTRKTSE
jgi:hypothetical protein